MLALKNISVKLGGKLILSNISFNAEKGINVILGPNGSGKTTLLRAIIGMVKYDGQIKINGEISYVPAEFFSPNMRVVDVLKAGVKKANYELYAKELNVNKFLDRDFSTLSSGERKLVLIAKALAEADNVIMDEPLSNLDVKNKFLVMNILKKFYDKTFLITSHELEILRYADKVIVINKGKLEYEGGLSDLSENLLSTVYGIKLRKIQLNGETFFNVIG
ncbi:ABC transporter ATP-binding protein [Saccharolobus solfataricus]|uniref:ABC transporter ATP-binding protein n=2 Tax=Saccharolobus solfataricus TaxID=2287 RepID=A0A0E3MC21_SACSO|nr:ABC transporter ATP-binding protein [Saccharolobus solfataricus]AKA73782.1 ABC transporter ATP-binding protein [Saccharolobus solfataricus]AKA76479.1 ABC transporter ATP-binding protein [Saccharolobus solfataricus]AKA79172.1 ABC transporter ATP-binding protein [Saccharolobus solfataricus]AZF68257.1 ABC transporter ATP-binding protein [Saccharolobus solfataricus]AZF70877.1 ABC transporter ATP-binding protein [Saccharolobus solfataricus]